MSEEKKALVGRPTKYDPKYCEELIDHMSQGYSYQSFAGVIEVAIDTLYQWEKNHQEFSDAKKIARAKCLKVWEQVGKDGMVAGNGFNAAVWIFNMKNRFKWSNMDHREEQKPKELPSSYNIVRYKDDKKIEDDSAKEG